MSQRAPGRKLAPSNKATKPAKPPGPPPGCPMHVPGAGGKKPKSVSATDLTYNDYLKVPELLRLQHPQSVPPHHDEMLFIVIHQAYELWFKLILHEFETVVKYMEAGDPLSAHHFMKRVVEIMKLLVQQIHLLETMSPIDFLEFRDRISPASGFQSMQFREIEFAAGLKDRKYLEYFRDRPDFIALLEKRLAGRDLLEVYYEMMRKLGYKLPPRATGAKGEAKILDALRPIYQKPSKHLPAYLLSESLVDFDQHLGLWREHHVRVVQRVIGFRRGTGGSSGVEYLQSTTQKKAFPLLWELRSHLQKEP